MRLLLSYRFRRSTLILGFCLGVLAGVGLAYRGPGLTVGFIYLLLPIVLLTWQRQSLVTVGLVLLLGLGLGWSRGLAYRQHLAAYSSLAETKVTLTATASEDAVYGTRKQLSFNVSNVTLTSDQKLTGSVALSGFGVNAVSRATKCWQQVSC